MDMFLRLAADPGAWAALATLIAMEVVLGLDHLVFIALLSNRIDERRRGSARGLGPSLAPVFRLVLLASASWAVRLTAPLATVFEHAFCARDLMLLAGGLFLALLGHPTAPAVRTRARRHGDPVEPLGAGRPRFGDRAARERRRHLWSMQPHLTQSSGLRLRPSVR